MRRSEADAADALDLRDGVDQHGEVGDAAVMRRAAIRVDILSQQVHFTHALRG